MARAFVAARPGVQVAVVPLGASGADLADALAALGDPAVVVGSGGVADAVAIDPHASTLAWGRQLADALAARLARVVVDLSGVTAHDGGAGLLAGLGAVADVDLTTGVAGLTGLTRMDLAPARALLGDTELVGVVPADQLGDLLLGLRGLTARRGYASGVVDPAGLLATDAALGRLAGVLGVPDAPGLGAAGGAALAVVALGGWLTSGPALVSQVAGLERTASAADVVVTGCQSLDAVARGGEVVTEVAAVAGRVERPCVVLARDAFVSGRELRTLGIESAHALGGGPQVTASELTERARGAAASWTW